MSNTDPQILVIEAGKKTFRSTLSELLNYHELLFFLAWRDIKVRYRHTALGFLWVLLQPLLTMTIFVIIFGGVMKKSTNNQAYALFVLSGIVPWQLFAYALLNSSNRLIENSALVTKIYFPRILLPLSSVLSGLVDLAIALVLLMIALILFGTNLSLNILFLPLFVVLTISAALAVGLWFCVFNVRYRDVKYTVPFLTQIWFFMTPIVYSVEMISEKYRWIFLLNPMTGIIEGFRWSIFGGQSIQLFPLIISTLLILSTLIGGVLYFQKSERVFADII